MKKLFSIVLTAALFFAHTTQAQRPALLARPYQPRFEKGTIRDFLEDIYRSTGIIIEYSSNSIDTGKIVLPGSSPSVVENFLRQVLKGQNVNIVEKNNKIILSPSAMPLAEGNQRVLYSFYGFVKDAFSKEPLSDASILEPQYGGTRSNNHGYFTLLVPAGRRVVSVSYTGYREQKIDLELKADRRLDIELVPRSDMEEAMIVPGANRQHPAGTGNLVADATSTNMMLGEPDIVRSIDLLPGVSSIPEISNGMLVRGGSPDQNVLLLEGNPIFNPTHLLGTVSIISKTSLKSFNLYKSSFPARFGGALSSVMDVSTKDGNMQEWKGEANTGLLAGSVTVEGPLKKDRTAIMLSFRNSWINPLLRFTKAGFDVNFYDAYFKCTQLVSSKDKLMLNVYAGHDKLNLQKDNINNQQQWGNKAVSLAWNRLLAPRAFVNSSVNISNYENTGGFRYALSDSGGPSSNTRVYNTFSSIRQYNIRTEAELYSSNTVRYNFGAKMSFTRIRPFNTNVSSGFIDNPDLRAFPTLYFKEISLFYENDIRINRFFLRPGVNVSHYQYGRFGYNSLQPRLYASYTLNAFHQLSFSYNRMTQNLHLVTNPYLGINSDAWVPSTSALSPEESNMINAGYLFTGRKKLTLGAELYYKKMKNVTNYIDGKNLFLNNADWEQYVQSGKGWSYGMEVKVAKKTSTWQTQLSYTLSWNQRQFKAVNNGARFPFKYDRRHMLNIAATYVRNSHWDFSALWSFATGDVYTLPDKIYSDFDVAQQIIDPLTPREYRLIYHSSAVNQYRTLPYHRLDISSGYHHHITRNTLSVLTTGIYNVYGSPSQYVYDLEGTVGKKSLIVTSRYKFFGITPYLSYSIIF